MKPQRAPWVIVIMVVAACGAGAQETYILPIAADASATPKQIIAQDLLAQEKAPQPPVAPSQPPAAPDQSPAIPAQLAETDAFTQAAPDLGGATAGPSPRMIGEFPGYYVLRTINVPALQTVTQFRNVRQQVGVDDFGKPIFRVVRVPIGSFQVPVTVPTVTRVHVGSSSVGFKIADNQSPLPEDRIFLTYNYFNNLHAPNGAFGNSGSITQQTTINDVTTISTVSPRFTPRQDLNGELFGFEKTLFDGRASVGLRLPLFQQQGDGSFSQQGFGDLGVFFNYAFFVDPTSGSGLSGGMLVTAPTGPAVDTTIGNVHTTVLQPFIGYRWNLSDFYLQGFTSVATPTDSRDVTFLFNDVGVGYWVFRGNPEQLVSAVIPTLEAHVTTPLNHRQQNDAVSASDVLTLTYAVQFGIFSRSMLTFGVATPVTGPRPFNIEAVAQFNYSF